MIGRLLEDGIFLGRFLWFYYKAPTETTQVGFTRAGVNYDPPPMQFKRRVTHAYKRASGMPNTRI